MEHLATLFLCGAIGLLLIMRVYHRADRGRRFAVRHGCGIVSFLKLVRLVGIRTERAAPLGRATRPIGRAMRWVKAIYRVLHGWWERERQRRELSMMRAPDFGDLAVPPSLVTEELRRWPWQKPNSLWGEVAAGRRSCNAEYGSDGLTRNRTR